MGITKIWKSEETSKTATFEDKFRITVDKSINWDGSIVADPDGDGSKNTGYVQIVKFTTATTPSASASRATPTTTATRSRRSRCKRHPLRWYSMGPLLFPPSDSRGAAHCGDARSLVVP